MNAYIRPLVVECTHSTHPPTYGLWRGHKIGTPFFAAADYVPYGGSASIPAVSKKKPTAEESKTEALDALGLLGALRYYGIPGWTSDDQK
jgi:hypothetical protein